MLQSPGLNSYLGSRAADRRIETDRLSCDFANYFFSVTLHANCFLQPGEKLTVIFNDPPGGEENIEMDINGQRITPKVLNPYTYELKLPGELARDLDQQHK